MSPLSGLTDDEIIALCESSDATLLSSPGYSTKVVQILPSIAVKHGFRISRQEFINQQIAYERLDQTIIRVPAALRYIGRGDYGYIVMDFVPGTPLLVTDAERYSEQLGSILCYLHTIQGGTIPGPFNGGPVQGAMWPDTEETHFESLTELEEWLSRRLLEDGKRILLQDYALVMCHNDFVPRNIIKHEDTFTLIDWSSAGYFPRFFEYLCPQFSFLDAPFYTALKPHVESLSEIEDNSIELVTKACRNAQVYSL
jgi:aminoglycoside phosphotransferase (APT) family kinase protein